MYICEVREIDVYSCRRSRRDHVDRRLLAPVAEVVVARAHVVHRARLRQFHQRAPEGGAHVVQQALVVGVGVVECVELLGRVSAVGGGGRGSDVASGGEGLHLGKMLRKNSAGRA